MAISMIGPKFYAWDDDGNPLKGGRVYTYRAGTNAPKATWQEEEQVNENPNPVILNDAGYADIYLDGSYKIRVTDSTGTEIWTEDPVTDPGRLWNEWASEIPATQYSATQFEVPGDQAALFAEDSRVRLTDAATLYGSVVDAQLISGNTRVTVSVDSGASLTNALTFVELANITPSSVARLNRGTQYRDTIEQVTGITPASLAEGQVFDISTGAGEGKWRATSNDISTEVTNDPLGGIYRPWDGTDGSSGGVVRFGFDYLRASWFGVSGSGDESSELQGAVSAMNLLKLPLSIDVDVEAKGVISTGFCELAGPGKFKAATGLNAYGLRIVNPMSMTTTYSAVAEEQFPAGTGSIVSKLTVASAAGLSVKDYVFIRDSDNTYSEDAGTTPVAEMAEIVGISGNSVYVNCVLRDTMTAGNVYVVPQNRCKIDLDIEVADRTNTASCFAIITIEGFVQPEVKTRCEFTNTRAVCPVSCYGGTFDVKQQGAVNDNINGDLGYAVACWGACKSVDFHIHAIKARHAFTDALWAGSTPEYAGACLDNSITGVAVSCSSAAWDTHPGSDGTLFYNIEAWATHQDADQPDDGQASAVQLRGTNAVVDGLRTNIPNIIAYTAPLQNLSRPSVDLVKNVTHRPKTPGNAVSLFDNANANDVKIIFSDCDIVGGVLSFSSTDYEVEFRGCDLDWQGSFVYPPTGNYSWLNTRIKDPSLFRVRAGEHRFQDFRLERIGGALAEGINLRQGAKVYATNVSIWADTVGYSRAFILAAETGIELRHAYTSLRIDSGTPAGVVQDTGATAPVIIDMAVS